MAPEHRSAYEHFGELPSTHASTNFVFELMQDQQKNVHKNNWYIPRCTVLQ